VARVVQFCDEKKKKLLFMESLQMTEALREEERWDMCIKGSRRCKNC